MKIVVAARIEAGQIESIRRQNDSMVSRAYTDAAA